MRHLKSGRKLKRNSSHRKALLNNLATSLFEHKKIVTTEAKAKELRAFAETLITKAKHALRNEKLGLLPEGHKIDIHNRRIVGRFITNKAVLQELFNTIAPMVEERPGGYTRIIKLGTRRGDGSPTAIIELVDWSSPQDGAVSTKSRRKGKATPSTAKKTKTTTKADESTPAEVKAVSGEIAEAQIPEAKATETNVASSEINEIAQEEITTETANNTLPADTLVSEEVKTPSEEPIAPEVAEIKDEVETESEESAKPDSEEETKENIS